MGCGPLQVVCDAVGSVVGGAASTAANAGFGMIAKSFAQAATTMCDWMWSAISTTTSVDLTGGWFKSDLAITAGLAGVMVSALFVLQLIKGALQRDPHALGRAVTGCGIAFLGAAAAITVTEILLALTDQLSDGVVHTAGLGDIASMGRKMTPVVVLGSGSFTPALVIALSFFMVIASILVWAVFIIRKAMLIIAAVFAPIAFGGAPADATRHWVRRWIEFTIAMIFSKLVIVLIFTVAISLIGQSGTGGNGLSNLMTGLLLLVMACFAPWMVFKLVHFVGGDIAAAHHSAMVSDSKAAASTAAAPVAAMRGSAQKVFASSRSGGAGAGAGAGVSAAPAAASAPVAAVGTVAARAASAPTRVAQAAAAAAPSAPSGSAAASPAGSEPSSNGTRSAATRTTPNRVPPTALSNHNVNWGEAT